jgi:uncharacterized protein Yka (UPF0111/DUF47 family)
MSNVSNESESFIKRLVNRVFPRMPDFYGLMSEQCDVLLEGMEALVEYMENCCDDTAQKVRQIEKRGDAIKQRNTDILNTAFATPMDREDIYRAIMALDLGMNYAKTTTREMEALNLKPDHFMLEMAMEYKQAAEALKQGFARLSEQPAEAEQYAYIARKTERSVEKIYRRALAALFSVDEVIKKLEAGEKGSKEQAMFTVVEMFKRREIYRHLSNGADRLARAADRLRDIVVKIS